MSVTPVHSRKCRKYREYIGGVSADKCNFDDFVLMRRRTVNNAYHASNGLNRKLSSSN